MARRPFTVFSLSFLDCICCGFGAVILLFVLMNSRASRSREELTRDLRGEVSRVEVEVLKLEKEKVLARNALDELVEELAETQGLSRQIIRDTEKLREELADREGDTLATREHVNQLKTDLLSLEEGLKRLKAGAESEEPGEAPLAIQGDGTRQYLTGLRLRGERTLILVDRSSSMLAARVVDILRVRNLPEAEQLGAPKWAQTRRSVDWLMARLPLRGQFHVAAFAETTVPLLEDPGWWDATDPVLRKKISEALATKPPAGGTSLLQAFAYAAALRPQPDNLIILTDGLPGMGDSPPVIRRTVSGRQREGFFRQAAARLPDGLPVNVLLFDMEGDPMASVLFWQLSVRTRGSFLTVAEDWP